MSTEKPTFFNLSTAIRKGSMENIASSLESPTTLTFTPTFDTPANKKVAANFSNLAQVVCNVKDTMPSSSSSSSLEDLDYDDEEQADEADDEDEEKKKQLMEDEEVQEGKEELTDEDSENLISDEEDDAESGFLSQM